MWFQRSLPWCYLKNCLVIFYFHLLYLSERFYLSFVLKEPGIFVWYWKLMEVPVLAVCFNNRFFSWVSLWFCSAGDTGIMFKVCVICGIFLQLVDTGNNGCFGRDILMRNITGYKGNLIPSVDLWHSVLGLFLCCKRELLGGDTELCLSQGPLPSGSPRHKLMLH